MFTSWEFINKGKEKTMAITKIKLLDRTPFKFMTATVGNLPTSFVDSMSYYEMLAWLCQYVTDTLIPQINANTEGINGVIDDMNALRKEVEEAIAEIPQLRADFEALVIRFDATIAELQRQYEAFEDAVEQEINSKIATIRSQIMEVVDSYYQTLNGKIDTEVARLDNKIETFPITNTIVFNTLRGEQTTLQVYLDDLSGLNRFEAITAGEYDGLELTAQNYDAREITAHDYDYLGKTILIG